MKSLVILLFFPMLVFAERNPNDCSRGKISPFLANFIEDSCVMPQTGRPQNVSIKRKDGTVQTAYRLTKVNDQNFVAEINPIFIRASLLPNRELQNALNPSPLFNQIQRTGREHVVYSQKIRECLEKYAPNLRGPNNEVLTIKVTADPGVPTAHIGIDRIGERSSSRNYAADINCETILHEVLHLLGLVDEYQEQEHTYQPKANSQGYEYVREVGQIRAFNCRAEGPENSIMHRQHAAVEDLTARSFAQVRCQCAQELENCLKFMDDAGDGLYSLRSCPRGFTESRVLPVAFNSQSKVATKKGSVASAPSNEVINAAPAGSFELTVNLGEGAPDRPSLLMPAHFRAITSPFCYSANRKYYECAQYSYKTSIFEPGKKCSMEAMRCQLDTSWLN